MPSHSSAASSSRPFPLWPYSLADLRQIIVYEQTLIPNDITLRASRTYLVKALSDFERQYPLNQRMNMFDGDALAVCVRKMCSSIVFKYSAKSILNNPEYHARMPLFARRQFLWINKHMGDRAWGAADEIMSDSNYTVDEIMAIVQQYRHVPDVDPEVFAFALSF